MAECKACGIWRRTSSGVLIPDGRMTDALTRSKGTFLDIKRRAEEIETLYSEAAVPLPPNSGLGRLIQNAKDLWDHWFANDVANLNHEMFFRGLHLVRIAEAVLPLRGEQHVVKYLKFLLLDSLDFFERGASRAKNFLWELEVWGKLRKGTQDVVLCDPPDVVVSCAGTRIGIACKKVYSERHVQNVLSKAVNQVAKDCAFGVVAMNIDDLIQPRVVLREANSAKVSEMLHELNGEFLQRHDRHFRKYLSAGRLISAIVSTSVITDVYEETPQFNNSNQWLVWTMPDLREAQQKAVDGLHNILIGS